MQSELGLMVQPEEMNNMAHTDSFIMKLLGSNGSRMNRSLESGSRENQPKILASDFRQEISVPPVLLFAFTKKGNRCAEEYQRF